MEDSYLLAVFFRTSDLIYMMNVTGSTPHSTALTDATNQPTLVWCDPLQK